MKKAGVAILGLGVVGGGTLEILLEKKKQIADEYGVDLTVVAVLDKFKEKVLKYGLDESIVADSIDDMLLAFEFDAFKYKKDRAYFLVEGVEIKLTE